MIPTPPAGAVRFNPPPGWDVPLGFDPRRGHRPDPTWPRAPEDWDYWVPDSGAGRYPVALPSATLPPGPAPSRERWRMIAIALGVLAVVVGLVLWSSASRDSSGTAVGSCWTGVEGGQMEEVSCGSSRATHQVEDRVTDIAECPVTSTGYFEDGRAFLCVKRLE